MFDEAVNHWLQGHPHLCAWLALLIAHQYWQSFNIRRVIGMRKGDGFWLMPPRLSDEEKAAGGRPWWKWIIFTIWHPKRPVPIRRRSVSRPPEPPVADFHDQKTPKV